MLGFSLGKPVFIDGQEVIVVRDVVGIPSGGREAEVFSIVESKGADGRPPIYVAENDLSRLREHYPGMNVYGLWQILFHNNAVKLGGQVITYHLSDSSGLYLVMEPGADTSLPAHISKSGEFVDNYIVDYIDFDLDNAVRIEADLAKLKLPSQPAYTRIELSDKIKAETNRRWMVVGGLCALIGVAALAVNYGLSTIHKSKMADYSTKRGLITELESRVGALAAERLVVRPDDSATLDQLFRLFEFYPGTTTPMLEEGMSVGFQGAHMLITTPNAEIDPGTVVRSVATELQPDFSYKVVINPLPAGESADPIAAGNGIEIARGQNR